MISVGPSHFARAATKRSPVDSSSTTDGFFSAANFRSTKSPLARTWVGGWRGQLLSPALEIGYLPIEHTGAVLFFQLMNRRYETASTVLTSNKGFEEWGEILGDDVMAAALIDRVLHHCHLIRGNSHRMREHSELYRALQSDVESSGETVRPTPPGEG